MLIKKFGSKFFFLSHKSNDNIEKFQSNEAMFIFLVLFLVFGLDLLSMRIIRKKNIQYQIIRSINQIDSNRNQRFFFVVACVFSETIYFTLNWRVIFRIKTKDTFYELFYGVLILRFGELL